MYGTFEWFDARRVRLQLDRGTRFIADRYTVRFATSSQIMNGRYSPEHTPGLAAFADTRRRFIWVNPTYLRNLQAWKSSVGCGSHVSAYRPTTRAGTRDEYDFTKYLLSHERMHERMTGPRHLPNEFIWNLFQVLEDERIERACSRLWYSGQMIMTRGAELFLTHAPDMPGDDSWAEFFTFLKVFPYSLRARRPWSGTPGKLTQSRFATVVDLVYQAWEAESASDVARIAKDIQDRLRAPSDPARDDAQKKLNSLREFIKHILESGRMQSGNPDDHQSGDDNKDINSTSRLHGIVRSGKDGQAVLDALKEIAGQMEEDSGDGESREKTLENIRTRLAKDAQDASSDPAQSSTRGLDYSKDIDQLVGTPNLVPWIEEDERLAPEISQLTRLLEPPRVEPADDEPNSVTGKFSVKQYRRDPERPFLSESPDLDKPTSMDVRIVVDRSGSMSGLPIAVAHRACLSLLRATESNDLISVQVYVTPYAAVHPWASSAMEPDMKYGRAMAIPADSGTDYAHVTKKVLVTDSDALSRSEATSRVFILLADGQTDSADMTSIRDLVKTCVSQDIVCLGLGVGMDYASCGQLRSMFGKDHTYAVPDVRDLPKVIEGVVSVIWERAMSAALRG